MMEAQHALQLPIQMMENIHLVWAFLLLVMRYSGMIMILPGIGGGVQGMLVRYPAVLVLAMATLRPEQALALPSNWVVMIGQGASEMLFGFGLALIPLTIISGVQMAGLLSSTSMGLGAGNLIDPTLGMPSSDLARIFGDISVILFLLMGGHIAVIYAVSGAGWALPPGSLTLDGFAIDVLMRASAEIFRIGVMISAPVIVALLLTQFVMGLITRAVPTVNVFVVSFPLTIGIGLILSMVSLREVTVLVQRELAGVERYAAEFVSAQQVP